MYIPALYTKRKYFILEAKVDNRIVEYLINIQS